jgi:hypothetical protein
MTVFGFYNLFKTGAFDGKGGRPLLVECGRMGNIIFFANFLCKFSLQIFFANFLCKFSLKIF